MLVLNLYKRKVFFVHCSCMDRTAKMSTAENENNYQSSTVDDGTNLEGTL